MTLGLAWLTELAGLSLALGAFVAGMLIAETEYKHQVETDIRPFHDVLLGLFFITIGMKLDWRRAGAVAAGDRADDAAGAVQVRAGDRARARLRRRAGVALRTGLYLAQAGEFGFVLLASPPSASCCRRTLQGAGAGEHGAVDAGDAVHLPATATAS